MTLNPFSRYQSIRPVHIKIQKNVTFCVSSSPFSWRSIDDIHPLSGSLKRSVRTERPVHRRNLLLNGANNFFP